MNVKRLLNTESGIAFISVLLGLGLATLFRKVCTDKNCITFKGPVINEIRDHIYKHNDKCYRYDENPTSCDSTKKIIDIDSEESAEKIKQAFVSDIYGPSYKEFNS
jgi:hypothetical protein